MLVCLRVGLVEYFVLGPYGFQCDVAVLLQRQVELWF